MDFDLNQQCCESRFEDCDEVNLYRLFEDIHRANERIDDDVGMKELRYDWDLNIDYVENEGEVVGCDGVPFVEGQVENADVEVHVEGDIGCEVNLESEDHEIDDDDHELIPPCVGDEYDCIEEAYQYYILFAKQCGFSVLKRSRHKKRGTDQVHQYVFACSKCRKEQTHIDERVPEKKRAAVPTGCNACLKLVDRDLNGKWSVKHINLEHNHELVPDKAFLISGFRYIPNQYQRMLEYNDDQGLAVSVNINLVIKTAGGYMRCPFTRRDARNHIDRHHRLKLKSLGGDDAQLLFEYFGNREKIDREFFYRYECTTDGRLWNIFWADGRSRASYQYFHDVIIMDATYLTNR